MLPVPNYSSGGLPCKPRQPYVFDVADRINLLRNGEITFDKPTADTSIEELTEIVASDYRAGS